MKKIVYIIIGAIAIATCLYFLLGNKEVRTDDVSWDEEEEEYEATETAETISEHPIYDRLTKELDSLEIFNDSVIYGYWFQPHAAPYANLFLHKNGKFEMILSEVSSKGTFEFDGKTIMLTSNDAWGDESFDGKVLYRHNGKNFYLTDSAEQMFYLVKGSD